VNNVRSFVIHNLHPLSNIMCMRIQEKELSEAEGWKTGLRALEWFRMRERERERERERQRERDRERDREREREREETGRCEYEYRIHKDSTY